MKVLWVTNTIFPELAEHMGIATPVVGGWMYGLAGAISSIPNVELRVATTSPKYEDIHWNGEQMTYHLLKSQKAPTQEDKSLYPKWKALVAEFEPDIVHIHGTEYAHGLSLKNACPHLNYAVSIQGLMGVYSGYYYAGLSRRTIWRNLTLRDFLRKDSIFHEKREFARREKQVEKHYLQEVKHIIGRTDWDKAHTFRYNPKRTYHFNNESLRDAFYTAEKWKAQSCIPRRIFISQASRPLKGFHLVLDALAQIKEQFPDLSIVVAGSDTTRNTKWVDKIKLKGYGKILRAKLKRYGLENYVEFAGLINESQMIENYQKCQVFICPSSIENSPNSVGEAQLLGVPVIASDVGGIINMVDHKKTGLLYRFEETALLASYIAEVFTNPTTQSTLSEKGIEAASKRHDRMANKDALYQIYNNIIG